MKTSDEIKIVIAEDSLTQAEKLKFILEKEGYKVYHGMDGLEALELVKRLKPNLVISDVMMPNMDGFQLCKTIKENAELKIIPVVLLTSLDQPFDIIKGLEIGADNYITKPYDSKTLVSRISTILLNSELRENRFSTIDLEIYFGGKKHKISSDRLQILDLLLSTFELSIQQNKDLTTAKRELAELNEGLELKVEQRTSSLKHLNKVLLSIRNVNQLIVKEKNPTKLVESACLLLTSQRGYKTAWINLISDEGKWDVSVESGIGDKFDKYKEQLKLNQIQPCCKKALEVDEIVVNEPSKAKCNGCALFESDNCDKMMISRLFHNEKLYGMLSVTMPEIIEIDGEEIDLFNEVSGDIGFALHDIELGKHLKNTNLTLSNQTKYLNERLKELNCLYSIDETLLLSGFTQDEIFYEILDIIQRSWQYPEFTAVQIKLHDRSYQTIKFQPTPWMLKTNIEQEHEKIGSIEVAYMEDVSDSSSGPFLEEEIVLLENISQKIERYLEGQTRERELIAAILKAERADKLKSSFLMNMSHEIRTPMNAIIGFSDLISKTTSTEEKRIQYSKMIQNSGDRLLHLIDDILDVSKIESGLLQISYSNCLVDKILSELLASFENQKIKLNLTELEIKISPNSLKNITISTDPFRLRQVLSNLLDNAFKFTEKGLIEFGYEIKAAADLETGSSPDLKVTEYLLFYVKDSGIGIDADQLEIIFDRFMKIEDKMKLYGGAGLGLTISRNIVRMLGGDMWVNSTPGQGSSFCFTLPLNKGIVKEEDEIKEILNPETIDWGDQTILVVEDEESNFSLLECGLEETGVKLIWAKNGQDAIDLCQANPSIDLILMDIKMPIMDGYTATREIKKFRTDLPIIAVTAFAMAKDIEQSIEAGCDAHIPKPLEMEILISMLGQYFKKK